MSRRRAACAWITAAVLLVAALAACAGGPPKEQIGPPPGMETASPGFAAASSGGGDRATATGEGLPTLAGAPDLAGKTPSGHVELREVETALLGAAGRGEGTLSFQGQTYAFAIAGLGGGAGISRIDASGEVYDLSDVAQFPAPTTSGAWAWHWAPAAATSGSRTMRA